ncbi:MAG: transglycosylase SLT domain-containing protein [candidate division Zixibacteria bacterium]|nr:transglycosylase SLT domain-containing protein [candidate division Zixibacteria bacterium]
MKSPYIHTIISVIVLCSVIGYPTLDSAGQDSAFWLPSSLIRSGDYDSARTVISNLGFSFEGDSLSLDIPTYGELHLSLPDILEVQRAYIAFQDSNSVDSVEFIKNTDHAPPLLQSLGDYINMQLYFRSENWDSALRLAEGLFQHSYNEWLYPEMLKIKGLAENAGGNYNQAADYFRMAAECELYNPTAAELFQEAAEMYQKAERYEDSYECYYSMVKKADRKLLKDTLYTELPTDDIHFVRKAGFIMHQRRLYRTTIKFLRDISYDDSLTYLEGLCRQRIGHYRNARRLFLSIEEGSPFADELYPRARFHAAVSAYLSRNPKTALTELSLFLDRWNEHPLYLEALGFRELIEINDGEKVQEVIEYIYDVPIPDRHFDLRQTLALSSAWKAFEERNYEEAFDLFFAFQESTDPDYYWNDSYYWAWRAAEEIGEEGMISYTLSMMNESDDDLYYPFLAHNSSFNTLRYDSLAVNNTIISFAEKWFRLKRSVLSNDTDLAPNLLIGLVALSYRLGFDTMAKSLFNELLHTNEMNLREVVLLLDYLFKFSHYDDFYKLVHKKKTYLEEAGNIDFLTYAPLYYREVLNSSTMSGLDPFLVWALIKNESLFDSEAESYAGALGLMQLMPRTARYTAGRMDIALDDVSELVNPSTNIQIGTTYLAGLIDRYDNNLIRALAAYNAGPTNLRRWLRKAEDRDDPYFADRYAVSQTRYYVKAVLNDYLRYRRLWAVNN